MNLPLHGTPETFLPDEPDAAVMGLVDILDGDEREQRAALRRLVADYPTFLDGWAHLAAEAYESGDPVAAYAFARTGYHRGLDRLRKHGWKGQGAVPWDHEPNRGFLRSVHALMLAAEEIGEADEAQRCRAFLLELDPEDRLGLGG
jgi:hypothetical protein